MPNYIYSTLTNSYHYTNWSRPSDPNMHPVKLSAVFIKGGANLANDKQFTPRGVVTEVTDVELEQLQQNITFQRHIKQGFIFVSPENMDAEVVAKKQMAAKDDSAPLTPTSDIFQKKAEDAVKPMEKV